MWRKKNPPVARIQSNIILCICTADTMTPAFTKQYLSGECYNQSTACISCSFYALTRRFLKFHHLFISKLWAIVDEAEAMIGVAVGTQCRLSNAASFDLHRSHIRTDNALEESFTHLRHNVRCSYHHASNRNKLIDICQHIKYVPLFTNNNPSQMLQSEKLNAILLIMTDFSSAN